MPNKSVENDVECQERSRQNACACTSEQTVARTLVFLCLKSLKYSLLERRDSVHIGVIYLFLYYKHRSNKLYLHDAEVRNFCKYIFL